MTRNKLMTPYFAIRKREKPKEMQQGIGNIIPAVSETRFEGEQSVRQFVICSMLQLVQVPAQHVHRLHHLKRPQNASPLLATISMIYEYRASSSQSSIH